MYPDVLTILVFTFCTASVKESFGAYMNVAEGKTAVQSSTTMGGDATRAVDGDTNSHFGGNSCTLTDNLPSQWWQVDFGSEYVIESVTIQNRGDCCGTNFHNIDILVGPTEDTLFTCFQYAGPAATGELLHFTCMIPVTGRYLKIAQTSVGDSPLSLCEVQAFTARSVSERYYRFPSKLGVGVAGSDVEVRGPGDCALMCLDESACKSFNLAKVSDSNYTCQTIVNIPSTTVNSANWDFYWCMC